MDAKVTGSQFNYPTLHPHDLKCRLVQSSIDYEIYHLQDKQRLPPIATDYHMRVICQFPDLTEPADHHPKEEDDQNPE